MFDGNNLLPIFLVVLIKPKIREHLIKLLSVVIEKQDNVKKFVKKKLTRAKGEMKHLMRDIST